MPPTIAETKGSLELTNLPVAIGTRSSGSTSAYSTLTAQPGVQIDNNNNIEVAGAGPSQLSFSIDGISSVGPGSLGALAEMFPSFNSIEEIKISEDAQSGRIRRRRRHDHHFQVGHQ